MGRGLQHPGISLPAGVLAPIGFVLPMALGVVLMSTSTVVLALNAQLLRRAELPTRARRIEGQVRGLQHQIEEDTYCIDVLQQIAAVSGTLQNVATGLLDEHVGRVANAAAAATGTRPVTWSPKPPRPSPGSARREARLTKAYANREERPWEHSVRRLSIGTAVQRAARRSVNVAMRRLSGARGRLGRGRGRR